MMNEISETEKRLITEAWDNFVSENSLVFVSSTLKFIAKQAFVVGWTAGQASVANLPTITTT